MYVQNNGLYFRKNIWRKKIQLFVEKVHIVPLQCTRTPSVNKLQLTKNKKITPYGLPHKTFGLFPFDPERESSMNCFFGLIQPKW